MVKTLTDYIRSLEDAVAMLKSPSILLPFIIFAGIQCVLLIACAFFTVPPLSSVMVPVVEWVSGEKALHYPMHFVLLPSTYHLLYLPLVVVIGFVFIGQAVFLMGDYYQRQGSRMKQRPGFLGSVPSMVVIGLVYVVLATAPSLLFDYLAGVVANVWGSRLLSASGVIIGMVFQVLLVYSLLFLRTGGRRAFGAIKQSVVYAGERFWLTFLLVLTVYLVHRPIDYLLNRPDNVVLKFDPEMVFFLLLSGIVLELVTSYMLFSCTASVVLSKREDGIG